MSEVIDGRQVTRDISLNDALANLQTMQGQSHIRYFINATRRLPFSQISL